MSLVGSSHTPLMGGLEIDVSRPGKSGSATLTGLAVRDDNTPVLITNMHVMAGNAEFSHRG